MNKLLATIAIALTLLGGIWLVNSSPDMQRAREERRYAAEVAQAEREERLAPVRAVLDPVVYAGTRLIALGGVVYLLVVLGGATQAFFRKRLVLVSPDDAGRVPVRLDGPEYQRLAAATLAGYHATQHERARQSAAVPVHYAPHLSTSQQHSVIPGAYPPGDVAVQSADDTLPGVVPTFAQLLDAGRIGRGNPLLLGIAADGDDLIGSWLDLYSTAIAGLPGTGKTTSQRFLACQVALYGARFVVCDPHDGSGSDSLGETLRPLVQAAGLCAVASSDRAIVEAAHLVNDIGTRRLHGDPDRTPVILWVDESTALLNRSGIGDDLATLLEAIAQEYRKVAVYASISGQIWTADRAGGSALRDSLASCLVHRMKRQQARMLVSPDAARIVEGLSVGRAVLYRTSGQTDVITIPNTTADDVRRVAGLLADSQPTMERAVGCRAGYQTPPEPAVPVATHQPVGSLPAACPEQATTAAECGKPASADAARAASLFLAGNDVSAVVFELRGVKSNEGRRYQTAVTEVQQLIREGLGWQKGGA